MIKITVGIATLNRYQYLIQTIEYSLAQQHPAVCEIILVDQSDDNVIQQNEKVTLQNWVVNGKIVWIKSKIKNLAAARNIILHKAKGDVIIFLDDDVILPDGFIEAHYKHYKKSNDLIAVAGLNYDRKDELPVDELNFTNYRGITTTRSTLEKYLESTDEFIGANHSISKELACLEGYDENFIGYGEDSDMAKRIVKSMKGRIICDPDAWLIHLRVPAGGCRITDKKIKRSEIQIVGPFFLYAIRHLEGIERKKALLNILRVGPLRKENVINFWRQTFVWFQFIYAFFWAFKRYKTGVKSPFIKSIK